MKFYDFKGSEYKALIWARDKETAINKYKEDICEDCKIVCKEIDIDVVRNSIIKDISIKLQEYFGDLAENFAIGGVDKYLLDIISRKETQIVLVDPNLD